MSGSLVDQFLLSGSTDELAAGFSLSEWLKYYQKDMGVK